MLHLQPRKKSFNAGSVLPLPSDLYPEASGFLFGIMNTIGAIPGIQLYHHSYSNKSLKLFKKNLNSITTFRILGGSSCGSGTPLWL